MRALKITTALGLVVGSFAVILLVLFGTKFSRFKHQSVKYHAEVAAACNFMLTHYPLGTNDDIEISGTDKDLPQVVRNLHPQEIKLAANWAWIWVNESHMDGLSITWEPQDKADTSVWHLVISDSEGPSKVVYIAKR